MFHEEDRAAAGTQGLQARPLTDHDLLHGHSRRGYSADLCLQAPPDSFELHCYAAHVAAGLLNSLQPKAQSPLHADTATGRIYYRAELRTRPGDFPDLTHMLVHNVLWNEIHSPLLPNHPGAIRCTPMPTATKPDCSRKQIAMAAYEVPVCNDSAVSMATQLTTAFTNISLKHWRCDILPGASFDDSDDVDSVLHNFLHYPGPHGTPRLCFALMNDPSIIFHLPTLDHILRYGDHCARERQARPGNQLSYH